MPSIRFRAPFDACRILGHAWSRSYTMVPDREGYLVHRSCERCHQRSTTLARATDVGRNRSTEAAVPSGSRATVSNGRLPWHSIVGTTGKNSARRPS